MTLADLQARMEAGDAHATRQLLKSARDNGNLALAIEAARRLGARNSLIALAEAAWTQPDALKRALAALGLAMAPGDAARITEAIAEINGQRRSHLFLLKHALQCLDEARHSGGNHKIFGYCAFPTAADYFAARRPVYGVGRTVERGFCKAVFCDDAHKTIRLELGVERIGPFDPAVPLSTALKIQIHAIDLSQEGLLPNPFPPDLRQQLNQFVAGDGALIHLMGALMTHLDDPSYPEAVAQAEAAIEGRNPKRYWLQHPTTLRHIVKPHGRLFRMLKVQLKELAELLDAVRDASITLDTIQALELSSLSLPDGTAELPEGLRDLNGLKHLTIEHFHDSPESLDRLASLRFPASLEHFSIGRTVPPETVDALVDHLAMDCPHLSTFAFLPTGRIDDKARGAAFERLSKLPPNVSLELLEHSRQKGDPTVFAQLDTHLAGRIHRATLEDRDEGHPILTGLGASSLVGEIRHLKATLTPGGLEALFAKGGWQFETLDIEMIYTRNSRLSKKQHDAVTFETKGIERLCASGALEGLRELRIAGILGPRHTALLAKALTSGPLRLKRLSLHLGHIGNDGLKALAQAGVLRGLYELALHEGRFKGKGLLALMDPNNGLQTPERLILTKNAMGKPILSALASWEPLRGVRLLDLSGVRITADNLSVLLGSPHLDPSALKGQ